MLLGWRCCSLTPFLWAEELLIWCFSPCVFEVAFHGFHSKIVILWHVKHIWFSVPLESLGWSGLCLYVVFFVLCLVPPCPERFTKKVVFFFLLKKLKVKNKLKNKVRIAESVWLSVLRLYNGAHWCSFCAAVWLIKWDPKWTCWRLFILCGGADPCVILRWSVVFGFAGEQAQRGTEARPPRSLPLSHPVSRPEQELSLFPPSFPEVFLLDLVKDNMFCHVPWF